MKKKLLLCLSILLIAAMAITGTMAYFTDTDTDVNVMLFGNVDIDQIEQEWNDDQNALVDFTQNKPLFPYVGSFGWENTDNADGAYRRFTMNNVIDKYVSVKNTGKSEAYVRTVIALEMGDYTYEEFDLVGVSINSANGSEFQFDGAWNWGGDFVAEIDGHNYYIMVATHEDPIIPGETTIPSLLQVYLSKEADNAEVEKLDGNGNGTYDILVKSMAVQTAGFANAEEAMKEAFGTPSAETVAEWFGSVNIPVAVSSVEDMVAALEAGETDIVVKGVKFTENPFNGRYYVDRNIDFVDCEFAANMNYMYINNATYTNCTFDCGSANSAVHYDELFGDLVFNDCTFVSGKVQIGANKEVTGTVTFNRCEFAETASTSIWSEAGIRVYSPAEFNNCEFNSRVVLAGANELPITFNQCTMNGGTPVYYTDNTDGIIRGGNIPSVTVND
ncbi:MAG: hypothetical protein IJX47_00775 [Clostridia bacterium]|nr:hypothetical protein [Clostridia bacterium]